MKADISLADLPLRPELVGEQPYGAPQLDVPVLPRGQLPQYITLDQICNVTHTITLYTFPDHLTFSYIIFDFLFKGKFFLFAMIFPAKFSLLAL